MKIVLVTGGSRGLGRSMAERAAARGFGVVLTYKLNAQEAANVVAAITGRGGRAATLQLDVAEAASFAAFSETLRGVLEKTLGASALDALVNNAGIGVHAPFAETTESQFDELMRVHLKAPLFTQALLPLLRDGARIVNVSSGLTRFSLPGYAAYAAMKGGVEVLTRYMAKELGSRNIRVNTLAPGAIETDFGGGVVRDNANLNKLIASQTALGRVGLLPDDIGAATATLLSEDSAWINAQRVEVSGGMFV